MAEHVFIEHGLAELRLGLGHPSAVSKARAITRAAQQVVVIASPRGLPA